MNWYETALSELEQKLTKCEADRDAATTKGRAYFLTLQARRLKAEIKKIEESRQRLAKCFAGRTINA